MAWLLLYRFCILFIAQFCSSPYALPLLKVKLVRQSVQACSEMMTNKLLPSPSNTPPTIPHLRRSRGGFRVTTPCTRSATVQRTTPPPPSPGHFSCESVSELTMTCTAMTLVTIIKRTIGYQCKVYKATYMTMMMSKR